MTQEGKSKRRKPNRPKQLSASPDVRKEEEPVVAQPRGQDDVEET
jgi:hypothetical protein